MEIRPNHIRISQAQKFRWFTLIMERISISLHLLVIGRFRRTFLAVIHIDDHVWSSMIEGIYRESLMRKIELRNFGETLWLHLNFKHLGNVKGTLKHTQHMIGSKGLAFLWQNFLPKSVWSSKSFENSYQMV